MHAMTGETHHPATDDAPPAIRRLPALLVNQIAAGEVVERPASVVKELVENAIDAGATRITVELEQGGIELVRVSDDGRGIHPDQIGLALAPHATSKIAHQDDLDRIATMGFRGEALASIASVGRMSIRSRARGEPEARLIEAAGDEVGAPRPASGPPGTTVEVRNLFFNTPARRKFLRTPQTEQTRCVDWLRDLAIAHPAIAFGATVNARRVLDVPGAQSPRDRALDVLGRELGDQLLEARFDRFDDDRGVTIWGLVGLPAIARATSKAQHVFLNGRAIRDKTVQHALREAYRGLIEPARHPTAVLMIEMAPSAIDVNVHPAKLEVRFRDQSMVHQAVLRAVRDALLAADLTPSAATKTPAFFGGGVPGRAARAPEPGLASGEVSVKPRLDDSRRDVPGRPAGHADFQAIRAAIEHADRHPARAPSSALPETAGGAVLPGVARARRVLQIHDSYLVTQDDQGLVLIDQHALHERVMFEKLLARLEAGGGRLESQGLLTPVVLDADPALIDRLDDLQPLLDTLGLGITPMGPRSVGVSAMPSLLVSRNVDPAGFAADLLARFEADGIPQSSEAALHEVLDMMACKAAVKAGDPLSDDELEELLALREQVERSGSCPHGRSTTVRLTIPELERLFDRR